MYRAGAAAAARVAIAVALLLGAAPALAVEPLIVVVASEQGGSHAEATEALLTELEQGGVGRGQVALIGRGDAATLGGHTPRLAIALGSAAAQALSDSESKVSQLYALLPRAAAEPLLAKAQGHRVASAIYLDQAYARQLELLRLALPEQRNVGVLWGPASEAHKPALSEAAAVRGLRLVSHSVDSSASLYAQLQRTLDEAQVLLAVAEPSIWNSSSIQYILLASFRARVPLVAFSPAYVRAGALLAIYATPAQIGSQAGVMARAVLAGRALPPPQYPAQFTVQVNGHVARALGLQLNENELTAKLLESERHR